MRCRLANPLEGSRGNNTVTGLFPPAGVEERLAESVVLRGPQRHMRPVRADQAAELLDAALLQEGVGLGFRVHDASMLPSLA